MNCTDNMKRVTKATVNLKKFWREGLTLEQASKDLGMSYVAITNLRKGTEKGSWTTLLNIARYFNVPVEDVIDIVEEEEGDEEGDEENPNSSNDIVI